MLDESKRRTIIKVTIVVCILILVGLVITVITLNQRGKRRPGDVVTPTTTRPPGVSSGFPGAGTTAAENRTVPATSMPTLAAGQGIDANSPAARASETSINTLSPYLPYSTSYHVNRRAVHIDIPSRAQTDMPWAIKIYIDPIDYDIQPTDPGYAAEKEAFLVGARAALAWVREHNIDTRTLVVSWNHRAYAQKRALQWLSEQ